MTAGTLCVHQGRRCDSVGLAQLNHAKHTFLVGTIHLRDVLDNKAIGLGFSNFHVRLSGVQQVAHFLAVNLIIGNNDLKLHRRRSFLDVFKQLIDTSGDDTLEIRIPDRRTFHRPTFTSGGLTVSKNSTVEAIHHKVNSGTDFSKNVRLLRFSTKNLQEIVQ